MGQKDEKRRAPAAGLHLIGLSYRTADVSLRSRAALQGERLESFLFALRAEGVAEATVLSTCNRTEIYFVPGDCAPETVLDLLSETTEVSKAELVPNLYRPVGVCAGCHLFRVAAGLDSAVLGETEIVAQVKVARREATLRPTDGAPSALELLFDRALEASKRVRTETDLCRNVTSLGGLAVREAKRILGSLDDRRIVLIGAGQMSERVAKELAGTGARNVTIINRTDSRALELAGRFGFTTAPIDALSDSFAAADLVIAAATAERPLLRAAEFSPESRPLVIDLGIPPNIDLAGLAPGELETVDVDALAHTCARNAERRSSAVPNALAIIDSELDRLLAALTERQAAPTIRALFEHGESVRTKTLDWAMERLPNLDDRERRVVEDLARRMMLGLLAPPVEELKRGGFSATDRASLERAFRIDAATGESTSLEPRSPAPARLSPAHPSGDDRLVL